MTAKQKQYFISLGLVLLVSAICYGISAWLGYRVVAFILLVTVSLIAISFDILPVLVSAMLSAFIWDFFFIPPRFTFHVGNTEDAILLVMYFIIAMISAVLTYKIRQIEKASRKKEEKVKTLKLYDTLLNSLSHELRTPIATIIAATDNIQSGSDKLTKENKDELINEISKASFRLNQQVENLLNMSRLETGFIKPKLDWCDINELVYDTAKKIEENKIGQKITININPDLPLVKTDKLLLGQVIYNLLNNASIYTKASNKINITALIHADILELIIEDDGDGFPPAEIENVFDKFYRLKYSKAGGTGLGLSIVKGFIEALKGNINLENISTGGAKFTITVPAEISYLKV
ncbi:MAG TPA: ATP-binding protein [Chitinophagaceae bacterium]|nr:ATP-binding protein [Chitinophagaceae bacterium]